MAKSIVYVLTASILGVLIIMAPIFFTSTIGHVEQLTEQVPQAFSDRIKAFENACGQPETMTQRLFNSIVILATGFAVAAVAYLLVKTKLSH
ncbi:MAG: hypothetical protein QW717_02155 [Candidatus Bathyarchaeia archaeon]